MIRDDKNEFLCSYCEPLRLRVCRSASVAISIKPRLEKCAPETCQSERGLVFLFVCPQRHSKTNDPKVFKLGIGNDVWIPYTWHGLG